MHCVANVSSTYKSERLCHFQCAATQVEILPAYVPSADEKATPSLFTSNVRKLMANRLDARLVDQGVEDNFTLKKAHIAVNLAGTRIVCNNGLAP